MSNVPIVVVATLVTAASGATAGLGGALGEPAVSTATESTLPAADVAVVPMLP